MKTFVAAVLVVVCLASGPAASACPPLAAGLAPVCAAPAAPVYQYQAVQQVQQFAAPVQYQVPVQQFSAPVQYQAAGVQFQQQFAPAYQAQQFLVPAQIAAGGCYPPVAQLPARGLPVFRLPHHGHAPRGVPVNAVPVPRVQRQVTRY